ncbi:MAG TPA: DUF6607 family protein [Pseudomonadales bacterium]
MGRRPLRALARWPTIALLLTAAAFAGAAEERRYTFSWPFVEGSAMAPRGGTTEGPDVTLADGPSDAWQRLREPGLSDFERDRRAILAMAGTYRTSFDFIETIGFTDDYRPPRPYQSWATEWVFPIADRPRFISLQHILVMHFRQDDGTLSPPMVVKHWRQDWRYEDRDIHRYAGHGVWQRHELPAEQVRGAWSQAVFQVDDSPRYQTVGRWSHYPSHSTWTSDETRRPLPRRESSVRDDYHALVGVNRVTITPHGWIHEEDNLKAVLDPAGRPDPELPYLAREAGLNRYRLIVGYDFSAGEDYWRRTAPFWAEVRAAWGRVLAERDRFRLRPDAGGEPLFQAMFELADRAGAADAADAAAAQREIETVLERYLTAAEPDGTAPTGTRAP